MFLKLTGNQFINLLEIVQEYGDSAAKRQLHLRKTIDQEEIEESEDVEELDRLNRELEIAVTKCEKAQKALDTLNQ